MFNPFIWTAILVGVVSFFYNLFAHRVTGHRDHLLYGGVSGFIVGYAVWMSDGGVAWMKYTGGALYGGLGMYMILEWWNTRPPRKRKKLSEKAKAKFRKIKAAVPRPLAPVPVGT